MVAISASLYLLALAHLLRPLWSPSLQHKFLSLLLLSQVAVCRLLKNLLAQYRPLLSCDHHKYGMPSAHACCALILLIYQWRK